jgi:predicted acetyltransferase
VPVQLRKQTAGSREYAALTTLYADWLAELAGPALVATAAIELQRWLHSADGELVAVLHDERLVGFACVRQLASQQQVLEEFYLVPGERGRGLGRAAAVLLFDRYAAAWQVAALQNNSRSQTFWRGLIAAYAGGRFHEQRRDGRVVYFFESRALGRAASSGAR